VCASPHGVDPGRDRALDFIVIGVQKGGTTSLWEYLRRHPSIAMPEHKEAPVLCAPDSRYPDLLAWLMRGFDGVASDVRLGKVATYYMMGRDAVSVDRVAERMAELLPRVRLIALLRDPVARAISQYRMSVRRGFERRPLDAAIEEQIAEGRTAADRPATETTTYVAQGEYGRVLRTYLRWFPLEQLHVEWTADLDRDPAGVVDRILRFLGLPAGYRPEGLGAHHHRGGSRPRIDGEAEAQLSRFMAESVWSRLGADAPRARRAFEFFLKTWNVIPDDESPVLSEPVRMRLEDRYRRDAELLPQAWGEPPWLGAWRSPI
jgi:Sulfotransferase domain